MPAGPQTRALRSSTHNWQQRRRQRGSAGMVHRRRVSRRCPQRTRDGACAQAAACRARQRRCPFLVQHRIQVDVGTLNAHLQGLAGLAGVGRAFGRLVGLCRRCFLCVALPPLLTAYGSTHRPAHLCCPSAAPPAGLQRTAGKQSAQVGLGSQQGCKLSAGAAGSGPPAPGEFLHSTQLRLKKSTGGASAAGPPAASRSSRQQEQPAAGAAGGSMRTRQRQRQHQQEQSAAAAHLRQGSPGPLESTS